jgi:hypothetical protein
MKKMTLASLMFIAFVISVHPSASPQAHAQDLCEYQPFIFWTCEDIPDPECVCDPGIASRDPDHPRCEVASNLDSFLDCCRECDGTVVRNNIQSN